MSKALLVIDMQEACVGKNHAEFFKYDSDIIAKVNEEIKANENIVYIRNLMKNNFINKLAPVQIFDGDKGAELAEDLLKKGNAVFIRLNAVTRIYIPDLVNVVMVCKVGECLNHSKHSLPPLRSGRRSHSTCVVGLRCINIGIRSREVCVVCRLLEICSEICLCRRHDSGICFCADIDDCDSVNIQ